MAVPKGTMDTGAAKRLINLANRPLAAGFTGATPVPFPLSPSGLGVLMGLWVGPFS